MIWLLAAMAMAGDVGEAVSGKLLTRDFEGCAAVWALGDEAAVRDALLEQAKAVRPAWVPMRAVECVAERAATDPIAFEAARGWMTDPAAPGFALIVIDQLGDLPEEQAMILADLAVERSRGDARFARYAPSRLEASPHARVREAADRIRKP